MEQPILAPLAQRWGRRANLPVEDIEAIEALPALRRSFSKDGFIVREGETGIYCSLLLKGFAYRHKLVGQGARQIMALHIPGEFVDLQNCLLPVADHNVQSLDQCELALIAKADLLALSDSRPTIGRAMWLDTLIDSSIFREWVVNVGRRDAKARIAHLLCELVTRLDATGMGQNGLYRFPMTQEQIADATGLTPVHTNRTLQTLRKEDLISLAGNVLIVRDWDRLRDVGDFSARYLHHPA
ncbi:Crp/Fnr family transcriptional regulator [Sphingomonas sp. M1-B02]|uniref:Crp/Fnr family transcriptional regulator n=1 Tax=Sphingomonas sp. M1-B02 TaxID=3114300 RepID=UPI002240596A|nr:Crp/Fnr family transcriptional regulator [Sphingomonas sp. S6-11]UZK67439.1 Crp/Fnr family transcriptional regulator [Sphingomonas sp. S6-11]